MNCTNCKEPIKPTQVKMLHKDNGRYFARETDNSQEPEPFCLNCALKEIAETNSFLKFMDKNEIEYHQDVQDEQNKGGWA